MENKDKPAYPTNARMHSDAVGMTKREVIAMAAMQGIITAADGRASIIEYPYCTKTAELAVEYADALLKQLEQPEEWISVKERLPEDYQRVLFFDSRDNNQEVGYFVPSQSKIQDYYTHWMPLPEPPKPEVD